MTTEIKNRLQQTIQKQRATIAAQKAKMISQQPKPLTPPKSGH